MPIEISLAAIQNADKLIRPLLISEFNISESYANQLFNDEVRPHLSKLKDSCYLVSETSYVDKVFRDSYYHYYSSKLNSYKRDCIRVLIFDDIIKEEDFITGEKLKSSFAGFFVLRPTMPFIFGRSIISPTVLKENTFLCIATKETCNLNGIKMSVEGFPHSSQDTETITCAETTLWAVMEYFGSKYPDYKPILPAKIIQTLNRISIERQIPSKGLNIQQISYALKEFGFGSRIYSRESYGDEVFERLLSCYIESGIPLVLGVDNWYNNGEIGHACLCIGHESINNTQIDNIPENFKLDDDLLGEVNRHGMKVYDWDDIKKDFIFIDDNCPIYQKASLDKPTSHYPDSAWHDCKINHFIVPLYSKIYLEAYEAKYFALSFLIKSKYAISTRDVLIRLYLASSSSYKNELFSNSTINSDVKTLIIETHMPRFIWVAEISTKELMKEKKALGLIVIDATEANLKGFCPLILATYDNKYFQPIDKNSEIIKDIDLSLQPFKIYEKNLKKL